MKRVLDWVRNALDAALLTGRIPPPLPAAADEAVLAFNAVPDDTDLVEVESGQPVRRGTVLRDPVGEY